MIQGTGEAQGEEVRSDLDREWSKEARSPGHLLLPDDRRARLRRLLFLTDLLSLTITSLAVFVLGGGSTELGLSLLVGSLFYLCALEAGGLYHLADHHLDHSMTAEVGPLATCAIWFAFAATLAAGLLTGDPVSVGWFALAWLLLLSFSVTTRAFARREARTSGWFRQPVVIIGYPDETERMLGRIARHPECGLDPVATIRRTSEGLVLLSLGENPERLASRPGFTSAEAAELVCESGARRVLVISWASGVDSRSELLRRLVSSRLYIDTVVGQPEALLSSGTKHDLEGAPILTIGPARISNFGRFIKRLLDIVASSIGLLVLSPLLAYAAIRISRESPGPIIFKQRRIGQHGAAFTMFKFRTMYWRSEDMRPEVYEREGGRYLKLPEDPRVTPFGARLRRNSIDELPQLWNVLRGEMSLVGPRPLPLDEAELVGDHYVERAEVRPGITGPWQVHGRSTIPFDEMVSLDYSYAASWSLLRDLQLLVRTVGAVLRRKGAY